MANNTVLKITQENLCTGCSLCAAVCPLDCITMEKTATGYYQPSIDESKCISCGKCFKTCSAKDEKCYSSDNLQNNEDWDYYAAHAKDADIRWNASSGGVVTQIIDALLEKGIYDDAFIIDSECIDDIKGTASYKESLKTHGRANTQKSRYLPASHLNTAKYMIANPEAKLIIVATPCCMISLQNMIELNHLSRDNYLFLGLFCDGTMSYNVLDYFKYKYSKLGEIEEFVFRTKENGGWPGKAMLTFKDREPLFLPREERIQTKNFFTLERCLYCTEKINPQADISVGDNYVKGQETKEGSGSLIVMTEKGKEVWSLLADLFVVSSQSFEDIKKSQHLGKKKSNITYRTMRKSEVMPGYGEPELKTEVKPSVKTRLKYRIKARWQRIGRQRKFGKIKFIIKVKSIIK